MPYWIIRDNQFSGRNTRDTIAIALAGNNDDSLVAYNSFINQRVGIKLGTAGANVHIVGNDFIQFSRPEPRSSYTRASIWIIPTKAPTVSGLTIESNKFGNENLDTEDVRILIADSVEPSQGEYFGDTKWSTGPAGGFIDGINVRDSNVFNGGVNGGKGTGVNPICYSYSANFRDNHISGTIGGTYPGLVVQFDSSLSQANDQYTTDNIFGPFLGYGVRSGNQIMAISNWTGIGVPVDPTGELALTNCPGAFSAAASSSQIGFINLLSGDLTSFTIVSGDYGDKKTIMDAAGQRTAISYTTGSTGRAQIYRALNRSLKSGVTIWIDVDVRQGTSGDPLQSIVFELRSADEKLLLTRLIALGTEWRHIRIPYTVQKTLSAPPILYLTSNNDNVTTRSVDIGRLKIYASSEPAAAGQFVDTVQTESGGYCQQAGKANVCWKTGATQPMGNCSNGSLYSDTDTGNLYICQSSTWVRK
jgi:hypothetical protein